MTTRRLAAILAADVAGFSGMMERDEEATAARIRSLRAEVIEPALARHQGRLVKTTGDGFLAEFASPVEAVRSALAIQDQLASANGVSLRIGINLGDILIEPDGDVLGDGVNVAARLEQLAEPGGIAISGAVHDHVAGKIDRTFEDRGEQQVKNIARRVRVYAVAGTRPSGSEPKALPLPDKPSIAVLPFTNMSDDRESDWFADGIVEDIITALSRFKWLFVIARNSSFTFKGRAVDVRRVGRELGVSYVLEGGVRRASNRVRITGQLVEAATGKHLWAERFEGTLEQVFELQDEVTAKVVSAVEPSLRAAEMRRIRAKPPTTDLGAYELYLRALHEFRSYTGTGYREAERLLRAAVSDDPEFSDAWALLVDTLGRQTLTAWFDDSELGKSETLLAARRAIDVGSDNAFALSAGAWGIAIFAGDTGTATPLAERALALNPNSSDIRTNIGYVFVYAGEPDRAIEQFSESMRMSPLDPRSHLNTTGLGLAHFSAGRFVQAEEWLRRAISDAPGVVVARRYLAATLAQLGREDEATGEVHALLRLAPNTSISRSLNFGFPPEMRSMLADGLRLAGLPE